MFELKGMGGGNECLKRRRPFILRPLFVWGGALSHWDAIVLRAPPPFKVRCMLQWDEGGGEDSSVDEGWGRSALKG